jgi:transposase
MLHAGLDLSRRKIDVCLLSSEGEIVDEWASPPDADGLRGLAARAAMWAPAARGVIESMNGARFVHDRLEEHGWDVLIADATKVKGLAPLACKTDKIDARVLATLSARATTTTQLTAPLASVCALKFIAGARRDLHLRCHGAPGPPIPMTRARRAGPIALDRRAPAQAPSARAHRRTSGRFSAWPPNSRSTRTPPGSGAGA